MNKKFKSVFYVALILFHIFFATHLSAQLPTKPDTYTVSSVQELRNLFTQLKQSTKPTVILVEPGLYSVTGRRLFMPRANITLLGRTGDPKDVIFDGGGMLNGVGFIFDVSHNNITISGLTLRNVKNHLIQVRAERGVSDFSLTNCILQDSFEQMLKVSGSNKDPDSPFSERGKVTNCLFEYTSGIGPQYYIGGIDAHRSKNWVVSNNIFRNIASPEKRVAQHAVHFWRKSADNIVRNNIIINSDRGIGFGLGNSDFDHTGGLITENFIFNEGKKDHLAANSGIILESASGAVVSNNHIYLLNNYPNAIEYRFENSNNNQIINNHANRRISSRNGGQAKLDSNSEETAILPTLKYILEKLNQ